MKLALLDAQTLGDDLDLSALEQFGELITYPSIEARKKLLEGIVENIKAYLR